MGRRVCFLVFAFCFLSCSQIPIDTANERLYFLSQQRPSDGIAESIGGYSSGCLIGASSLFEQGPGYVVMRSSRGRFWGHPDLVSFLEDLGNKWATDQKNQIMIGDLSQARGGPMLSQHLSHQTGLDVDIWWQLHNLPLGQRLGEGETQIARSILSDDKSALRSEMWGKEQIALLQLAAQDKRVERILVTPLVKKYLCSLDKNEQWPDQDLKKVRPWWGHDDHFHVRLMCPEGSSECKAQGVPTEVGCDKSLEWWFSDEAKKPSKQVEVKPEKMDWAQFYQMQVQKLPQRCQDILMN